MVGWVSKARLVCVVSVVLHAHTQLMMMLHHRGHSLVVSERQCGCGTDSVAGSSTCTTTRADISYTVHMIYAQLAATHDTA